MLLLVVSDTAEDAADAVLTAASAPTSIVPPQNLLAASGAGFLGRNNAAGSVAAQRKIDGDRPCEVEYGVTAAVGWEQPLLDRILAGDSEALLDLYARVGRLVYSRARRITNEHLVAGLITVGVFTLVWRRPQDFSADRLQHSLQLLADQRATNWIYE
ncbi:MAG: hypothetical protein M3460_27230 [Actinomycetota bacterium]|nr:hypothetical protein [Actinomycetota bacterium]